ncbi:uncharacterized protein LOC132191251 isoform X1 [Corylus avellana]|uniref:uncharacterized protein LOC132191251 isoform X1 n=1 Tax=Corylus avellana TaxID=13451 RepID=UPI00286C47F3|nr:uncharacterized protein LOC132191251 isoform X1 [Corylus avellana]XP_059462175.1 uncharacterized protein LOC132191251 isoform X1 [Corylus avellana]
MAIKLQRNSFFHSSSSDAWVSGKPIRTCLSCKQVANSDHVLINWGNLRKRCVIRLALLERNNHGLNHWLVGYRKNCLTFRKSRRMGHLRPFASGDEGVTVNGSPQASTSGGVEGMRVKLNQSLQGEDYSDGLIQYLHEAARIFELAIKEQGPLSKISWFSTAWLGIDRNAWLKTLSYQASVYCLLQAVIEISSRGDGRDRDINLVVQRSLLRQSAPLESLIRDKLSSNQPEAFEWFWSEQVPMVVTSFVNYFEGGGRFSAATAVFGKGMSLGSGNASDEAVLMLALTCIAAITKLGPAKVSCQQFFSMIPEITGRLMDMLVDFIPIRQAYYSMKDMGLHREFLVHFGPRAAACRVNNDSGAEEVVFWVNLVQKQLQRAIDREKIWSRLTTSESIEVLERDLAIFGFFVALGRSTKSFLSASGFDVIDDPIDSYIRYLIGGSVLYYPQLSSISSYQLYVEVVCEELDWLPFYPGNFVTQKQLHGHRSKREGPPDAEAIPQVIDVCSHWMQSFIKYSKWLEKPSNVKAAKFLSRGHNKLSECMEELGILKNDMVESSNKNSVGRTGSMTYSPTEKELDSFDKALESVEEALIRLEKLLQELHVSSSGSGKEHLKAACSDLEKIRKLKKEAEFLGASFRAKADFLQQGESRISGQQQHLKGKNRNGANVVLDRSDRVVNKSRGLWSFFMRPPARKPGPESVSDGSENECMEQNTSNADVADSESNEIRRFELLRNELIELERRVQRSADQSENEEFKVTDDGDNYQDDATGSQLVQVQKKDSIIEKSFVKLKEASTDVWQGTQLLAIDVAASMVLLRRVLIGDELTEKEKKAFKRTMTDLASVVPIGVLMLLPVTAVGHAAMLAAIQRYVPAMIPSTYGPERLYLLRQLEKVKEMEPDEENPNENVEELA